MSLLPGPLVDRLLTRGFTMNEENRSALDRELFSELI